jgi:arabinofuranan 3-O-arabinosyltransferase
MDQLTAGASSPADARTQRAIPPVLLTGCRVLLCVAILYLLIDILAHGWIYNREGLGIPTDFVNVWTAGQFALDGRPSLAWDWDIQKQAEVALLQQDFNGYLAWHYPPPFLFVAALLAQFPYAVAFLGWAFVSMLPYLAVVRAIVGRNFGLLLAVAFPPVVINTFVGQNGCLTAALIGGTLYLLPLRPVLAGVCLGLLSYKPQYGVLFPIVLVAAAQWTTFFTAATVAVGLAFVSWLQFGSASWQAFFHGIPRFSQTFLHNSDSLWWKLQSLYALIRCLDGPETLAWTVHVILVGAVAVALVVIWRSQRPYAVKAAALALGTLLSTPYLYMYDMVVLAIAAAFLVRQGLHDGFEPYEPVVLAGAMVLLSSFLLIAEPVGLAANLLVAGLVLRRADLRWSAVRAEVRKPTHSYI